MSAEQDGISRLVNVLGFYTFCGTFYRAYNFEGAVERHTGARNIKKIQNVQ
jgi:hypothetical protein